MSELLAMFKKTIGDLSTSTELDDYYKNFITIAKSSLLAEDISEDVLDTEVGMAAIVLYSEKLMDKEGIADNPTLNLLKNLLSAQTKGGRI
jgi:hypothetical protein